MQPTAWANAPRGARPIRVRDGFLQGACEAPVAFALALRVALAEFEDEMKKQASGAIKNLEYWAYVDDIPLATTPEQASFYHEQAQRNIGETRHGAEK